VIESPEHVELRKARAARGWLTRRRRAKLAQLIGTARSIGMSADTIKAIFGAL
jgi:hypothetical protein